ncbi:MAG: hypothetical protein ACI80K_003292, partial [Paracoccaceae bacterium]
MHILLLSLACSLFPAPDLDSSIRELGAPRLEQRVRAEGEVAAALRLAVGSGYVVEGAGRARALSSRDAYESALGVLRASLVESADLRADAPGAAASRRRLSVILGSDDQLLGFAVRLAADGRPAVRSVGQDALLAQL